MRKIAIWLIILAGAMVPCCSSAIDTTAAYSLLTDRAAANLEAFYVYQDADSGFNHGFPSGFFADSPATLPKIHLDAACLDDASSPMGCSTDSNRLDRDRVNVLRISFDPLTSGQFAGVNIEEPHNWGTNPRGVGYDLRGSTEVDFDIRSPDLAHVQVGVGGCVTPFLAIPGTWSHMAINLASLKAPPNVAVSCPPNLSDVHLLFSVATNASNAPNGGTVLLDNIRFDPVPSAQTSRPSFPLSTATFGVHPLQAPATGRVTIPPDQVNRNVTTVYESAVAMLALLDRGTSTDLESARRIADAFDYALRHDNQGDPLPLAPDGSGGLHNGYFSGDLPLLNDGEASPDKAGQVRLSGFSAGTFCGPTLFCLVLDGATGGNNAFAMLALLAAYDQFGNNVYLDDARTIANWMAGTLTDTTGTGFGGYFLGYPDAGVVPKTLIKGKSIENNADIFVAFTRLAAVETRLGNNTAAALWTNRANVAGDFVMAMFDGNSGCFFAGTVLPGTSPSPGISPTGAQRGNDVINTFLFLDSNTFTTEALAEAARYRNQIDWRRPVQCVLDRFGRTVSTGGQTYKGFSIDGTTAAGPNGIAWEFTGQAVVVMRLIDELYGETTFEASAASYLNEIQRAQASSPFGDGRGLVASTLDNGETVPPGEQCLTTPFQCIPARVGLAATTWAIFADRQLNPLSPGAPCVPDSQTLCFLGGRFQAQLTWKKFDGGTGVGQAVPLTTNAGVFWFFDPTNLEMLLKLLDACSFNDRFWVFYAATTNVEFTLRVTDTRTGRVKTYFNPLGTPAAPILDTDAFATCP
jgi:hypothetical protein